MRKQINRSKAQELTQRFIVLATVAIVLISLCALHGSRGKSRAIHLIDQMIERGNLTGKFWRITALGDGQITLTKYQRVVVLSCSTPRDVRIGDNVSFIAERPIPQAGDFGPWQPKNVHFHGTSWFKYGLSVLSSLLIFVLCLRHFHLDNHSLTFIPR
jgi:hypothetical protein